MYIRRTRRAPQYAYAVGAASADAGQRQFNRLLQPGKHLSYTVTVEGDLIATAAGGTVQNRGSILAAFDRMGVFENGQDRRNVDFRIERMWADAQGDSALTTVRATVPAGAGTQHLIETFRVYFGNRKQIRASESAFVVKDPRADLFFFHQLNNTANGLARVLSGGTASLQNVKVSVIQNFTARDTEKPNFIQTVRQISQVVAAANAALEIPLRPQWGLRGLVIQQDVGGLEVSDIINKIALRGDNSDIIGPELVEISQLIADEESDFGGAVKANGAYYILDFCRNGRLGTQLNPTQDTNLRLVVDCQPSLTAGASAINIALYELEHDLNRTDSAGVPLVAQPTYSY